MGIDITELRKKLEEQASRLHRAQSNGMMVNQETERTKNVLLNNLDEIIAALKAAEGAAEQIKELEVEIASADAELKELDDEIKMLRAGTGKQPMKNNKAKAEPDGE